MMKKIVSLLLSLLMLISLMPTVALAAGSNISMTVTPSAHTLDTLRVGDTVTVTVVNNAMTVTSLVFNVKFDKNKFECKSIKGTGKNPDKYYLVDQYDDTVPSGTASTTAEANNSGTIGFGWAATSDANYKATTIVTITFEVKAVGSATFVLTEKSDGQDSFIGQVSTTPVTIPKAAITSVTFTLDAPVKGKTLPTLSGPGSGYTGDVEWYEGTSATGTAVTGNAKPGQKYTAKVTLTASSDESFANSVTFPTDYTKDSSSTSTKLVLTRTFHATAGADSLGGIVTIDNASPKLGDTLTANTTGLTYGSETVGILSYQWYSGDTAIFSATGSSYTTADADVGKTIKVEVKNSNNSDSVFSAPTAAVAAADYTGSGATAAVTDDAHRWDTKIEITNVIDGQEYAITKGSTGTTEPTEGWQDDGVFTTGLTKDTAYTVYTRVRATDTMAASTSKTTLVKTKKAMDLGAFDLSGLTSVYHYNGSALNPSVSYKSGYTAATVGGLTFKYEKNEGSYPPVSECKLPGAYRVTIVTDNNGSDYAAGESYVGVFSISPGNLTAANFQVTGLTHDYDGNPKAATVALQSGMEGVGAFTVYYEGVAPTVYTRQTTAPTNAGSYKVSVDVATGDYYNGVDKLALGTLTINKVNYSGTTTFAETVRSDQATTGKTLTLPTLPAGASYGTPTVGGTAPALISAQSVSGNTLTYSTTSKANNTSATITIPVIGATNYNDYSIVVTVTAKDKQMLTIAGVTMNAASYTYGDTVSYNKSGLSVTGVTTPAFDNATLEYIYSGTLTDGTHFTAGTAAPTKAGSYTLTIKVPDSNANYMGEQVINFTIAKKDVTAAMIAGIPAQTYTGSAIQPKPAVTDGVALSEGTDFTYSYDANTDVATGGKVTITGKGNYKGTADKTFTISRKNINGATINLTAASLPYNGSEQTVSITSVTLTGWTITAGDYDIVGNSNKGTNVGSTTLTIQGKGNYIGTATTTWEITAIDPVLANFDVTPALSTAQTYDGAHKTVTVVPKSGINGMGTVKVYYEATAGITYPKSETAPTDVGTYKVTASVAAGSNYNAKDIDVGALTINQATGGTLAAYNFQQKYTDLTAKTITPDYSGLPAGQKWTYSVSTPTTSGAAAVASPSIGADTGVLSYTLTAGAKDDTVKWTVTISSHNYADFTKDVTLTLTDKDDQAALTLTGGTTVVYGQTLQLGTSGGSTNGAVTYTVTPGTGNATVDNATGKLTPTKAGDVTVTATMAGNAAYNDVTSASKTITINKATVTVAAKNQSIYVGGTVPSLTSPVKDTHYTVTGLVGSDALVGTLAMKYKKAGADATPTAATTGTYDIVISGVSEPNTTNYNPIVLTNGTLTISNPSYSGGGGGSSHASRYTITVDKTENGTITVSPKSASKGDTVTITVKPDKGYELDTLKVLDKDGDKVKLTEKKGKYTFTMPAGKVTVKGKFVEEAPEQIFVDVPVDAYCYEAVKWAASEGITGGIGNNLFAPGLPCTRGQIVTFLWRAAGSPAPKSMSSFTDIAEDAYYAKAVAWAVENGITGGTGDGKFSPDATCTRAQAVTFLYRASGSPAVSGSAAFSDVAADAYYASAVKWAEKNGITGGIGGGLFGSGNNCTRGQIVTFLYRSVK